MPDALYDRDILIWSEQQADLLRRLAAGEQVNEAVDWPHVIEEVEDVTITTHHLRVLPCPAIVHLMKVRIEPGGPVAHWTDEIDLFLDEALSRSSPAMRGRIDLGNVYVPALRRVRRHRRSGTPEFPATCPYTLDELLADEPDVDSLLAKLGETAAA